MEKPIILPFGFLQVVDRFDEYAHAASEAPHISPKMRELVGFGDTYHRRGIEAALETINEEYSGVGADIEVPSVEGHEGEQQRGRLIGLVGAKITPEGKPVLGGVAVLTNMVGQPLFVPVEVGQSGRVTLAPDVMTTPKPARQVIEDLWPPRIRERSRKAGNKGSIRGR